MFGSKEKEIRITLGYEGFRALIRGGSVLIKRPDKPDVRMILSDIGFECMYEEIEEAAINGVSGFETESIVVDDHA